MLKCIYFSLQNPIKLWLEHRAWEKIFSNFSDKWMFCVSIHFYCYELKGSYLKQIASLSLGPMESLKFVSHFCNSGSKIFRRESNFSCVILKYWKNFASSSIKSGKSVWYSPRVSLFLLILWHQNRGFLFCFSSSSIRTALTIASSSSTSITLCTKWHNKKQLGSLAALNETR